MTTMSFDEYVEVMKKTATSIGATATLENGFISNGKPITRLAIRKEGESVATAFRISEMYQEYLDNPSILESQLSSVKSHHEVPVELNAFVQDFSNGTFETIKDKLVYSVMNKNIHKDFLSTVPHVNHLDLCIVFFVDLGDTYQIPITNSLVDMWGVTVEELWRHASKNTVETAGVNIMGLPGNMIVITNSCHYKGAGLMFDKTVLYSLACQYDCSFYILPSSIHEVLAIPVPAVDKENGLDNLRLLVKEVNGNSKIVSPDEVLSNEVYFYDRSTNKITFA